MKNSFTGFFSLRALDSSTTLKEIYLQEEIAGEKSINRINLSFSFSFIILVILLPLSTGKPILEGSYQSNMSGLTLYFIYNCGLYFYLKKGLYHPLTKYVTTTVTISIVTLIVAGYHSDVDLVHSMRTVTRNAYFLLICASAMYQNPNIPLYASILISFEYSLLIIAVILTGTPVLLEMETFKQNIMTLDLWIVNISFYIGSGLIMYLISKRHRSLIVLLKESSDLLGQERKYRKKSEEKASFYENYDGLTELPNHRYFQEKLEKQLVLAKSRNQLIAVMCLGIDSLKNVNQLYGTETGHNILIETGKRLTKGYREDDFVARFMGDKFLILFQDIKTDRNISDLIMKTQELFNTPYSQESVKIKVTVCAGFATFPDDDSNAVGLIKKSEMAMFAAKANGKGQFYLHNIERQDDLDQRIRIEREFENALANDEFYMLYQPKVNIDGSVIGMESLVRWNSSCLGPVFPDQFIPVAEHSDFIIPLGYHIFDICCRQIKKWADAGYKTLRVSVNVSPHQFTQKDFVEQIKNIMTRYKIDSAWLGLEITESSMIHNEESCVRKLNALKDLGLTLSIDDFGKGYSSLSRLGRYPVDVLKIDKAFVDEIPGSANAECIIHSIIDLAQNLKYTVIAEGVENIQQIDFLRGLGCERFQGYYYYKPLPADKMEKLLLKR